MMDIIRWVIETCLPGLIVGILMAVWSAQQKKHSKDVAVKEDLTRRKDALQISLLVATAEMSYAQVMALKRGSPNGEVEVALRRYNKAMDEFRRFEREQLGYME